MDFHPFTFFHFYHWLQAGCLYQVYFSSIWPNALIIIIIITYSMVWPNQLINSPRISACWRNILQWLEDKINSKSALLGWCIVLAFFLVMEGELGWLIFWKVKKGEFQTGDMKWNKLTAMKECNWHFVKKEQERRRGKI